MVLSTGKAMKEYLDPETTLQRYGASIPDSDYEFTLTFFIYNLQQPFNTQKDRNRNPYI